jgi:hypothetical protein
MEDLKFYHHGGRVTGSLRLDVFGTPFYLKVIRAANVLFAGTANESLALDVDHIRATRKDGAAYAKVECADDGRVWIVGWHTWDTRSRSAPWGNGYGEQRLLKTKHLRQRHANGDALSLQLGFAELGGAS